MNLRHKDPLSIIHKKGRLFYSGVGASVVLHILILSFYMIPREELKEEIVARIEWEEEDTPFVVPQPQMAREFAFKKQRVPQGTPVVRSSGDRTATIVRGGTIGGVRSMSSARQWSKSGGSSDFVVAIGTGDISDMVVGIPQFEAVEMASLKEPEKRIDMQAEFLDLAAINTGKYKGMVIQDPTNKQNIQGFVYLGLAWGSVLEPAYKRAMPELVRALNYHTRIEAQVDEQMFLDSQALFKAPFVYISASRAFELTDHEAKNLGEYLHNGGFVVADNAQPHLEYGPAEASIKAMFKKALGRYARWVPLRNEHPIYHVFFDFDGGPPHGGDVGGRVNRLTGRSEAVYFLEGIYIRDRLVAVYSDKGYGAFWQGGTSEPHMKVGINFVVFALTQKGSIAQQQIDFYSQGQ
jgi:hypothetical protein